MLTEAGCEQRRANLWSRLPESITACVVADPRHVGYLSNFRVQPLSFSRGERALLLLERDGGPNGGPAGKATLAADNFARRTADAEVFCDEFLETGWYDHKHSVTNRDHATFEALADRGGIGGTTLLEAEWCPAFVGEVCRDILKTDAELHFAAAGGKLGSLGEDETLGALIRDLRRQKLPDEIDCLKTCMKAGDAGHAKALEVAAPGVTDLEVYNAIHTAANKAAGTPGILYGDFQATRVGQGKAGGLPKGEALKNGDLLILDFSFVLHGYRSDFTNTVAVGEPSERQRELFDACVASLEAGEGVLKAGAEAKGVYAACTGVLEDRGFGELSHHAGHGLGDGAPGAADPGAGVDGRAAGGRRGDARARQLPRRDRRRAGGTQLSHHRRRVRAAQRPPADAHAVSGPLAWVSGELAKLDAAGLRRTPRVCRASPGGRVEVDGRELWNFGSNDYLGLASAEPVTPRPGGASALWGATASPAVTGRSPELAELERAFAEFEGAEDAVVFPTGYAANLGTVAALTGPGDAVFVERDCHACLVDGAKLGGGRLRVWRRGDLPRLERELEKAAGNGRRWVVTDAVFSMDGDAAPLPGLLELADRHDAAVILDEAHATGVLGETGRGLAGACGVPPDHPRLVRTGTLSKAVGAAGGFVGGSRDLCDYIRHAAKSHLFSTALPPAVAAIAAANLHWIASDAGAAAREQLNRLGTRLTGTLGSAFGPGRVPGTPGLPIVPLIVGDPGTAVAASAKLADAGFFVPAIRPPTVRRGTSRLRISLSAAHPEDAVDALADALIRISKDAA